MLNYVAKTHRDASYLHLMTADYHASEHNSSYVARKESRLSGLSGAKLAVFTTFNFYNKILFFKILNTFSS